MIPNGITTEWKKRQPKSKLLNFILSLSIFTSFLIIAIGLPLIWKQEKKQNSGLINSFAIYRVDTKICPITPQDILEKEWRKWKVISQSVKKPENNTKN